MVMFASANFCALIQIGTFIYGNLFLVCSQFRRLGYHYSLFTIDFEEKTQN